MLLALALCGCGTTRSHFELSPAFDPGSLRSGDLIVAGITSLLAPDADPLAVSAHFAPILEEKFWEERGILIGAWSETERALGTERSRTLLRTHLEYGRLDPSALTALEAAVRGPARFALVARLETDKIDENRTTTEGETVLTTSREISVSFRAYDLDTRAEVCRAVITRIEESRETLEDESFIVAFARGVLESALGGTELGETAWSDPEQIDMVSTVFEEFAKRLMPRE